MSDELEKVIVKHQEGEDKPWHIDLEGVGVLGTGRALLNHPTRNFETREEAEEVAEKIRELIKADQVELQDEKAHHRLETDYDAAIQEEAARESLPPQPSNSGTSSFPATGTRDSASTGTVDNPPAATDEEIIQDTRALTAEDRMREADVDPLLADDYEQDDHIVGEYPDGEQYEGEPIVLTPVDPETQPEGPLAVVDDVPPKHAEAPQKEDVDMLVEPREVDRDTALEDLQEGEQESEIRDRNLM